MIQRFAAILFVFLAASCAKDIEMFIPNDETTVFPVEGLVSSSLTGILVDESGQPVAGTQINYGDGQSITDGYGVFYLEKVEVHEDHAALSFQVPGYFVSSPVLYTSESSNGFVRIVLRERVQSASFQANQPGLINPTSDLFFQIQSESITEANGDPYEDEVAVFTSFLDPTILNDFRQVPGNGIGKDLSEKEVSIEPYGVFYMEFDGTSGQELKIDESAELVTSIEIPDDLLNDAPTQIGLWHYNTTIGQWEEVATATKSDNFYECPVNETGIWAVAKKHEFLEIKGFAQDAESRRFEHAGLVIKFLSGNYCATTYIDATGNYRLRLPKDEELVLSLLDDCDGSMYATNLGGLSGNTVLPPIIVDNADAYQSWIRGSFNSCNTTVLEKGYVLLSTPSWTKPVVIDENGSFTSHLGACDQEVFSLQGVSLLEDSYSLLISHPFVDQMELGAINVCPSIAPSFSGFNVDGEEFLEMELTAIPQGDLTLIEDVSGYFNLTIPGTSSGLFQLEVGDFSVGPYSASQIAASNVLVFLDEFGSVNESLQGSINGYFTDTDGNEHWVFGRFRAEVQ